MWEVSTIGTSDKRLKQPTRFGRPFEDSNAHRGSRLSCFPCNGATSPVRRFLKKPSLRFSSSAEMQQKVSAKVFSTTDWVLAIHAPSQRVESIVHRAPQ